MAVSQHAESDHDSEVLNGLVHISDNLNPDTPDAKSLLSDYCDQVERVCGNINIEHKGYLLDFVMILVDGIEQLSCVDRNLLPSECAFLQRVPLILADYTKTQTSNTADQKFLELLKDQHWIRPITEDEEMLFESLGIGHDEAQGSGYIELEDLLSDIAKDQVTESSSAGSAKHAFDIVDSSDQIVSSEDYSSPSDIDEDQQELIDLIKAELAEIAEFLEQPDHDISRMEVDHCITVLKNMADQAENIANAVELIGLEGLSQCARYVSISIDALAHADQGLTDHQVSILKQWPLIISGYLQNFSDSDAIEHLLALLTDAEWGDVLSNEECENIRYLLDNPIFIEDEHEERQSRATESDVDLSLPDDVNHELLDGLLQDLPAQTEEFSTAIQNILEGGGMENIDVAQRIAHTLKGAANVVGVTGIANLTHHLEDILQTQAKNSLLPDQELVNVLVRASDCLESMAETLLGIDSQPEDAVSVLQDVLDWANRLDNSTVPRNEIKPPVSVSAPTKPDRADGEEPAPGPAIPNNETAGKANAQSDITAENVLRIPVSLADEMLRLAGENLIYTSQIQEHIDVISRKHNALELHNQSLQQLSYDLEHLIDIQGFMPGADSSQGDDIFDPLELDEYHEVHTISRRLVELAADSIELSNELDRDLSGLKELVVNQSQLHKDSEELVLRTRMIPIKTIIPRLKRGVRQASRSTGKLVDLVVNDNNTFMDSNVLNNLIEPLMHLLRNSIDHGIEHEQDRLARGKAPTGTISLNFDRQGNNILIDVIDDGCGLDTDVIYSKALIEGLILPDEDHSREKINRLILEPGFTTRNKVTQVSGRGIGLDVVSVKIRELKGTIDISSSAGKGCKFTLSLPVSSFSTHSLLVRSRQYIYAISSHGVEEILYPGIGDIRDVGEEMIFHLGQEAYTAVLLDDLLDLPPDRRKLERNIRPILLVRDESGSKTAVLVQEVIDSRDIVVKNMGSYMPKLRGILGATVLGDGSVSPVFDLPEMLHGEPIQHDNHDNRGLNSSTAQQSPRLPYVLVVDDSLSARRSLAQFVEDLGFIVRTARDGMEAVKIIEKSKPDLLIVDMEMPKMNGLELTSHVRATPEINGIPVIMVTSRSTDKHRQTAIEKGVDHYMVKPFDEDELSLNIHNMLELS